MKFHQEDIACIALLQVIISYLHDCLEKDLLSIDGDDMIEFKNIIWEGRESISLFIEKNIDCALFYPPIKGLSKLLFREIMKG